MFAPPAPEPIQDAELAERVSIPEDADRMREQAFRVQEWTSKAFGLTEAKGNQYRLTFNLKTRHYYLESVSPSRYCGLMIPEADLFNIANVFLASARAKKESDDNGFG